MKFWFLSVKTALILIESKFDIELCREKHSFEYFIGNFNFLFNTIMAKN